LSYARAQISAALPGVRRPMALGFKTDEIRRVLTMGDPGKL